MAALHCMQKSKELLKNALFTTVLADFILVFTEKISFEDSFRRNA